MRCPPRDIDIKYFKASQCERGTGEFRKFVADPDNIKLGERDRLNAISREFVSLIVPRELALVGVGIHQEDFFKLTRDDSARAVLGRDPYWLAYHLAMIVCAACARKLREEDHPPKHPNDYHRVSFVCDESEQYSTLAGEAYKHLKNQNPAAEKYMATRTDADEKDLCPLQAADAIVYEIRRALQISIGMKGGPSREQFGILRPRIGVIFNATEENLRNIVSRNKPGEPIDLDAIMDLSILAEDVHMKI